ncbi:MAG TPA: hypothetical protein PLJ21_07395 [Pseudobdellovibrionaceae bacterium]|nr:hypothetical protein [Pseudobdellovibrionaceae bacterium]
MKLITLILLFHFSIISFANTCNSIFPPAPHVQVLRKGMSAQNLVLQLKNPKNPNNTNRHNNIPVSQLNIPEQVIQIRLFAHDFSTIAALKNINYFMKVWVDERMVLWEGGGFEGPFALNYTNLYTLQTIRTTNDQAIVRLIFENEFRSLNHIMNSSSGLFQKRDDLPIKNYKVNFKLNETAQLVLMDLGVIPQGIYGLQITTLDPMPITTEPRSTDSFHTSEYLFEIQD